MEKGDKPKTGGKPAKPIKSTKQKKPSASLMKEKKPKDKKPAKQKQKQKQKQENVQIVKVNVNTSKEEKPTAKPVRKEITKQTTYITLDKPYALQPEEEELLTITKHVPNPPRDKSSAKVTTLVSNPKNEIPQTNIQEQPLQIPVPIKKKVSAKQEKQIIELEPEPSAPLKKKKEPKKKVLAKTVEEEQELIVETTKSMKSQKVKEIIPSSNSSNIDKTIQNSSINNNEKLEEMLIAEPTVSEKKTGLKIKPKLKLEEMLIAEPTVSEKQTGLKINKNIKPKLALKVEQVEEEVITERTPIPTKIELKKQELRKIESEMRDISTRNPLYDGLKEQRNNLYDEIDMLREIKKLSTETVPKMIVKETMEEILTKIEKPDLEEEVYDYITNTDDANISNPNSGEKINIENEPELEEEFGLTSAQVLSYKEDYVMTPKGSVKGLIEKIEKKRGAPIKYTTEEERKQASKEQKKASALRKKEEAKAIKQMETDIEYEQFIQGHYPPDSLEEMIQKDLIQKKQKEQLLFPEGNKVSPDIQVAQEITGEEEIQTVPFATYIYEIKEKPVIGERLSSDFVSSLVDKLSDNNNYNSNQSAQEPQFEFE